jgi:membrane protease YdiL (CAAX protease family)
MWAAILINGVLFGLLHIFNDGATVLAIIEIMICGITYSLIRWYTGNIWIAMGIHTGWNFTQAFLLGMPNSGLVSEVSLFHLESANGVSNLIYDFKFGVEGGLPAVIVDLIPAVVVLILAKKNGRLKELAMSREKDQNKPQNLAYTGQNLVS